MLVLFNKNHIESMACHILQNTVQAAITSVAAGTAGKLNDKVWSGDEP